LSPGHSPAAALQFALKFTCASPAQLGTSVDDQGPRRDCPRRTGRVRPLQLGLSKALLSSSSVCLSGSAAAECHLCGGINARQHVLHLSQMIVEQRRTDEVTSPTGDGPPERQLVASSPSWSDPSFLGANSRSPRACCSIYYNHLYSAEVDEGHARRSTAGLPTVGLCSLRTSSRCGSTRLLLYVSLASPCSTPAPSKASRGAHDSIQPHVHAKSEEVPS
jgi:hypothetical protein